MEFFMIEGNLVEHPNMNDELMKEHKAYTKKAMDAGMILFSGLKKGMDGVVFVMCFFAYKRNICPQKFERSNEKKRS